MISLRQPGPGGRRGSIPATQGNQTRSLVAETKIFCYIHIIKEIDKQPRWSLPIETTEPQLGLVDAFHADLLSLSLTDVIRKHISTGQPLGITSDEYFELRRTVATEFELHPSEVVVVGSTRMGFSLNPKRTFQNMRSNSDIDIAIVSQERFDDYWNKVFEYSRSSTVWDSASKFRKNLFNGWIDPRYLPTVPSFSMATKWARFFDELMQSRKFGMRTITARLYRTWDRLEAYQERSISKCKLKLPRT